MSEFTIAPGARLTKPLVHPQTHMVMLPAGTVLTAAYIERLTNQGLAEQLAACLEAPTPAAPGDGPSAKDLDDFEIDIPDLPDILADFMAPPPPAATAPPPAWTNPTPAAAAGHPAPATAPAAQPAGPPGAPTWPAGGPPAQPAPPPAWMNPAGAAPAQPIAPAVPVYQAPPPPGVPQQRYYHNPGHVMPERGLLGAMHAAEQVDLSMRSGQLPAVEGLASVIEEVLDRLANAAPRLGDGIELRVVNQPHAKSHPVNVFLLSAAMGLALGYDRESLRTLGLAALCHDIGKTAIPPAVLDKVGPLAQQDVDLLRAHSLMGKRIIEKMPWGTPLVARVVYEHHERNDGSGYPLRLVDQQIHEMSKIVAVAEVYDALASDTSYRVRYSPELAYTAIRDGARTGLDASVIRAFMKYVVPYPLNSFVQLTSGEIGQVVQISRMNVLKPTIKVAGTTIDLARDDRRSIANSVYQAF